MKVVCIKVVCINNKSYMTQVFGEGKLLGEEKSVPLTIGKSYEVLDGVYNYIIRNDINVRTQYSKDRFISLEEYREQKLNKL